MIILVQICVVVLSLTAVHGVCGRSCLIMIWLFLTSGHLSYMLSIWHFITYLKFHINKKSLFRSSFQLTGLGPTMLQWTWHGQVITILQSEWSVHACVCGVSNHTLRRTALLILWVVF